MANGKPFAREMPKALGQRYAYLTQHKAARDEMDIESMAAVEERAATCVSQKLVDYLHEGRYDDYEAELQKLENFIYNTPQH